MRGRARAVLTAAGVSLGVFLIYGLGPARIWSVLSAGRWGAFVWVLGAYAFQQALGTFALWALGTGRDGWGWKATPLATLARIRYLGEVINYSMPTGGLGGEPYKYLALSPAEGRGAATRALSAAKFLHVTAVGPFAASVFLGAALLWTDGADGASVGLYAGWRASFLALGFGSLLVTLAVWGFVLWRGLGGALVMAFYRIRRRVPARLRGARRLLSIDRAASAQIRRTPGRAVLAWGCYVAMWWAAAAEWVAIGVVLGVGTETLGLIGGGLFECATILVAGAVPVPAGVGTQEAGKTAVAAILGMGAETGLSMSLVRRAREAVMVAAAIALALYGGGAGRGRRGGGTTPGRPSP